MGTASRIVMSQSGTNLPRVDLDPLGFEIEFEIRRSHLPASTLWKQSMKQAKESAIGQIKPKAKKNFEYDQLGNEYVRIHMEKQDFSKLELNRRKALKRKLPEAPEP